MITAPFRVPSAWLPLAMSGAAIVVLAAQLLLVGTRHEADEGAAAHLWQLLMVGQVPLIIWFLARRVPLGLRNAMPVLAAQALAIAIAAAPVALLGL
jgi:hypothetical protein